MNVKLPDKNVSTVSTECKCQKVGVLPIRIVKSNVSSVGRSSESERNISCTQCYVSICLGTWQKLVVRNRGWFPELLVYTGNWHVPAVYRLWTSACLTIKNNLIPLVVEIYSGLGYRIRCFRPQLRSLSWRMRKLLSSTIHFLFLFAVQCCKSVKPPSSLFWVNHTLQDNNGEKNS